MAAFWAKSFVLPSPVCHGPARFAASVAIGALLMSRRPAAEGPGPVTEEGRSADLVCQPHPTLNTPSTPPRARLSLKLALHCRQPCCLHRVPIEHGAELIVPICSGLNGVETHARAELEK